MWPVSHREVKPGRLLGGPWSRTEEALGVGVGVGSKKGPAGVEAGKDWGQQEQEMSSLHSGYRRWWLNVR
jgi:hypothetical protein